MKFRAYWEMGKVIKGALLINNVSVVDLVSTNHILLEDKQNGVIIGKKNKWIYYGGIVGDKCCGKGYIYCTF